ncbi:MAG: hypothetical protein FWG68_08125 [Defluviitaleaceae bacterium]|nr:hypothetical protein [Defluviitaleaceae bacterium]
MNQTRPDLPPSGQNLSEAPMSLGDWLIVLLIGIIPCVNIIMLIVWAVSSTGNVNRKHYAQAFIIFNIIVYAIVIVASIVFWAAFAALFSEIAMYL